MRIVSLILVAIFSWAHVLNINVPAPENQILNNTIIVEDCAYINTPGAPNLPCKTVTVALPPGAIVETVEFHGAREEIGTVTIFPSQPMLPLMNDDVVAKMEELYEHQKKMFYASNRLYHEEYGNVLSTGGLRKYTLIDLACYHFAHKPLSQKLYYAPTINVQINYNIPAPESERAKFYRNLINDITFDDIAEEMIYNWSDARVWYHTETPKRANGYYIILPSAIQNAVDSLVAYRQSQGYDVNIVTREYIEANIPGDDLPQKIRNYLRQNMVDIEYALFVGFMTDMPWRLIVPWNNDPDSPYNDPDFSPIPSDLYYAELTDHDTLSWNSDRDEHYGEVYDSLTQPNGEDNPDYHADIHVGRIPFSTQSVIEDICIKMIAFDCNTDVTYKTASLLTGALYYYENENHSGNPRNDGADYMEQLMDDTVLNRSNATYLYEKGGLGPCTYPCTDSLTRSNHISYWQNMGIMYECHHGASGQYARKLWAWDDGDGVPENHEIQWPSSLVATDVYQLDNNYPATSFLRSCLCGKPEVTGLGAMLLYRGSSSVISSSRVAWMSGADPGGIPYHFFDRLMKDTTSSNGIIGNAYDMARTDFMNTAMFWLPAYHYNLFGDPALRQFGRLVSIQEVDQKTKVCSFAVYPNPTSGQVTICLSSAQKRRIKIDIYDGTGRFINQFYAGYLEGTNAVNIDLPTGIYFIKLTDGTLTEFKKVVIIK